MHVLSGVEAMLASLSNRPMRAHLARRQSSTYRFGAMAAVLCSGLMLPNPAAAEIVIGTVGPMAGQYSSFGTQMRAGAEKAVEHINAAGGVNGEMLRLEVADDGCSENGAIAAANQMVGKDAVFVAGHFCSVSSIPAAQVYHDNGIVQISPASSDPRYTEEAPGPGILRVRPRNDMQGSVAGEVLSLMYPGGTIGIVHDRSTYGEGLATRVRQALYGAGIVETFFIGFDSKDVDYNDLVERMRGPDLDAVYFGGYHTEAGLLIREMREQGIDAVMLGGDTLVTDEFWTIAGEAGEGTLMTFATDARNLESARELVLDFETDGTDPIGFTLYTYAAVKVWADAANAAGSTEVEAVAEALRDRTFETAVGPIAFDEKGDITAPDFDWYEWSNGRYGPWAAPEPEPEADEAAATESQ
jgi:branched-chain amino acid transport system substrate-binding protein